MGNVNYINAGAGSGKTYTLTKMLCDWLAKDVKPSEFILTTYTKAAADEFRSKIKARLMSENRHDMVPLVESAQIGTIHAVAQTYVEKYWYLLDMSPRLSLKDEMEMLAFRERVLELVTSDTDLEFFNKYSFQFDLGKPDFWKEYVIDIVDKLSSYGQPLTVLDGFKKASKSIVEEIYGASKLDMTKLKGLGDETKKYLYSITGRSAAKAQELYNQYVMPFVQSPSLKTCAPVYRTIDDENASNWVKDIPLDFHEFVCKYVETSARLLALECVDRIFDLAKRLYNQIYASKKAEGVLDFSDLEVLFLKLLSFDSVRTDIASSIKFVYVDEFQDVSPIQLSIFQKLSDIVSGSCWVGDPKQAIYGFRGSDTELSNSVISSFSEEDVNELKYSYRSLPKLVDASNDMFINAFASLCATQRLEEKYVKLEKCDKKIAEQNEIGDTYRGVHHWWVSNPTQKGQSKVYASTKLYPALAAKLLSIFEANDFKVTDTDSDDKPYVRDLKYGDVAILTPYRDQVTAIADALRAKGLPVSVLDDKLDTQIEIRLVLALMKYVAGIDERHTLAELRSLLREDDLEVILRDLASGNVCHDLKHFLDTLRVNYQYFSVYDMMRALIAALDIRHMVCKWSMGQKRQANIDALVSLASTFQKRRKDASVSEFIKYVNNVKLNFPFDNSGNSIKVLTYHKSKGLQWKMVILNALHRDSLENRTFVEKDFAKVNVISGDDGAVAFNLFPPAGGLSKLVSAKAAASVNAKKLWDDLVDKRRAEDLRLLYVGFTRAENYLVRLSIGDCPSKWLDNTNAHFKADLPKDTICDNGAVLASGTVLKALPYGRIKSQSDVELKRISPSKCEGSMDGVSCNVSKIAGNVDVSRYEVEADQFGTCIHNYMAIHKWAPDDTEVFERNYANAARVLEGYGLSSYVDAKTIVKQADAMYKHITDTYGDIAEIMHEVPFAHRRNGQVVNGEIDLYVMTTKGEGLLIDFKNPLLYRKAEDVDLAAKAVKYWPQMQAYRDALVAYGKPVDHIFIYYPMLGMVAKF